jgi:hypothetical protein
MAPRRSRALSSLIGIFQAISTNRFPTGLNGVLVLGSAWAMRSAPGVYRFEVKALGELRTVAPVAAWLSD